MTTTTKFPGFWLTAADMGTIAACMDDALKLRLGDDGTVEAAAGNIAQELGEDFEYAERLAAFELSYRR